MFEDWRVRLSKFCRSPGHPLVASGPRAHLPAPLSFPVLLSQSRMAHLAQESGQTGRWARGPRWARKSAAELPPLDLCRTAHSSFLRDHGGLGIAPVLPHGGLMGPLRLTQRPRCPPESMKALGLTCDSSRQARSRRCDKGDTCQSSESSCFLELPGTLTVGT